MFSQDGRPKPVGLLPIPGQLCTVNFLGTSAIVRVADILYNSKIMKRSTRPTDLVVSTFGPGFGHVLLPY